MNKRRRDALDEVLIHVCFVAVPIGFALAALLAGYSLATLANQVK